MNRNYSLLADYDVLDETEIFPESFIDEQARQFELEKTSLQKLLYDVVGTYEDNGHYYIHEPYRRECNLLAKRTLKRIQDVRDEWSRLSEGGKEMFLEEGGYEQLIENLNSVSESLEDFASYDMSRPRGNPGKSRKSQNLNLHMFTGVVEMLCQYWEETKNQPMGHEIEGDHYDEDSGDEHYVAKSPGIAFAMACLQRLDDRMTLESCKTLIKRIKKARKAEAHL